MERLSVSLWAMLLIRPLLLQQSENLTGVWRAGPGCWQGSDLATVVCSRWPHSLEWCSAQGLAAGLDLCDALSVVRVLQDESPGWLLVCFQRLGAVMLSWKHQHCRKGSSWSMDERWPEIGWLLHMVQLLPSWAKVLLTPVPQMPLTTCSNAFPQHLPYSHHCGQPSSLHGPIMQDELSEYVEKILWTDPWGCSRPGWMGPWAARSSIKCGGWWPCLQQGELEIHDPWAPFQPGPFCDLLLKVLIDLFFSSSLRRQLAGRSCPWLLSQRSTQKRDVSPAPD